MSTLQTIVAIVKENESTAANEISSLSKKISIQSAKKIVLDVKDHIEGKMSEAELRHYIDEFGIC